MTTKSALNSHISRSRSQVRRRKNEREQKHKAELERQKNQMEQKHKAELERARALGEIEGRIEGYSLGRLEGMKAQMRAQHVRGPKKAA